jgi:phosphoglycolate phosphatase-like HAD superfamily hydrolase
MEEAGVKDKKDVLYIGDTIYDYQTALNAGVDCMMVTWSPRKLDKSIKPKYYLDSYQDLIEVLYGK